MTHTLRNSDVLSFLTAGGQKRQEIGLDKAGDVEGWRGEDERKIHYGGSGNEPQGGEESWTVLMKELLIKVKIVGPMMSLRMCFKLDDWSERFIFIIY